MPRDWNAISKGTTPKKTSTRNWDSIKNQMLPVQGPKTLEETYPQLNTPDNSLDMRDEQSISSYMQNTETGAEIPVSNIVNLSEQPKEPSLLEKVGKWGYDKVTNFLSDVTNKPSQTWLDSAIKSDNVAAAAKLGLATANASKDVLLNTSSVIRNALLGRKQEYKPDYSAVDYLKEGGADLNKIENPIARGFAIGGSELVSDPLTFFGGGVIDDIAKVKQLKPGAGYSITEAAKQGENISKSIPMSKFSGEVIVPKDERFLPAPKFSNRLLLPEGKLTTPDVIEALPPKPTKPNSSLQEAANSFYDDAVNKYNSAIEEIQNYFGTSELRASEQARIKNELGIDLDSITSELTQAEYYKNNPAAFGERERLRIISGATTPIENKFMNDLVTYDEAQNNVKYNVPEQYKKETPFTVAKSTIPPKVQNPFKREVLGSTLTENKFNPFATNNVVKSKNEVTTARLSPEPTQGNVNLPTLKNVGQNVTQKAKINGKDINILPDEGDGIVRYTIKDETGREVNVAMEKSKFDKLATDINPVETMQNTGKEVSKLYTNTLQKTDILTDAEKAMLNPEDFEYIKKANVETLDNARKRVAQGIDIEINNLYNKEAFTSDDFVTSIEILKDKFLNEYRQTGDKTELVKWLKNTRKAGSTEAGRVVQAHQIYTRTPEGMLVAAQKAVDKHGGELTPKDIKDIVDNMDTYQKTTDPFKKEASLYKAQKVVAEKVPPSFIEKYKGLQRISWLLNPKTLLARNPIGNVILGVAENIKDIPGSALDYAVSLFTGKRTTTMPGIKRMGEQLKGSAQGFSDVIKDWKAGVDTSPTRGQAELPKRSVFSNNNPVGRTLNKADTVVGKLLQLGDRPFYQAAVNDRLAQFKKLGREIDETALAEAKDYALERTFQNDTSLSKLFQGVKSAAERAHPVWGAFMNTILPFAQTPANILNKLLEYTPAGLVKAVAQLGGKPFNQKKFVDNVGRSLTGTGAIALGYTLAEKGIVTGKPDRDKDVASIERLMGLLPYSIKIGDTSYTYDWAQPVSALLAMGADAYYSGKDKESFADQLKASAEAAGNTFFNMSMLQSLTNTLNKYAPAAGLITGAASASGLVTPTLGSQTAKVIDPFMRETRSDNAGREFLNRLQSKTPFASDKLPAKLDNYGKPIEQFQGRGTVAKLFESYLSPGYIGQEKTTAEQKELYKLYKSTGNKDILPKLVPESITHKGEKIQLTTEEMQQFQKTMGAESEKFVNLIPKLKGTDENKAKILASQMDAAREKAKQEILKKKGLK